MSLLINLPPHSISFHPRTISKEKVARFSISFDVKGVEPSYDTKRFPRPPPGEEEQETPSVMPLSRFIAYSVGT